MYVKRYKKTTFYCAHVLYICVLDMFLMLLLMFFNANDEMLMDDGNTFPIRIYMYISIFVMFQAYLNINICM
jgi:hypothetical protein